MTVGATKAGMAAHSASHTNARDEVADETSIHHRLTTCVSGQSRSSTPSPSSGSVTPPSPTTSRAATPSAPTPMSDPPRHPRRRRTHPPRYIRHLRPSTAMILLFVSLSAGFLFLFLLAAPRPAPTSRAGVAFDLTPYSATVAVCDRNSHGRMVCTGIANVEGGEGWREFMGTRRDGRGSWEYTLPWVRDDVSIKNEGSEGGGGAGGAGMLLYKPMREVLQGALDEQCAWDRYRGGDWEERRPPLLHRIDMALMRGEARMREVVRNTMDAVREMVREWSRVPWLWWRGVLREHPVVGRWWLGEQLMCTPEGEGEGNVEGMLRTLKGAAEAYLGSKVRRVSVVVPSDLSRFQRQAIECVVGRLGLQITEPGFRIAAPMALQNAWDYSDDEVERPYLVVGYSRAELSATLAKEDDWRLEVEKRQTWDELGAEQGRWDKHHQQKVGKSLRGFLEGAKVQKLVLFGDRGSEAWLMDELSRILGKSSEELGVDGNCDVVFDPAKGAAAFWAVS
ncbi:hypothetical protein K461DRAFT_269805 [Myriangium duriaei CBS 260.36]|uniref:Uncharacterized protein n=1 Tax=Myriangium duriaei CBS 260.36 TaxID=1168546 RepID=A0A9P4IXL6_9PEZI|nr:hypothetical protein K461DRAFT_269805 [Myriangium duriaei CBS 260.36]